MANIKSQIKRNRQNEKRRLRNRNYRGAARTAVTQARSAFESGAPETKETVMAAISMLDKAAERGVLHSNNAARRKGRLMKRLAALGIQLSARVEEPKAVETETVVEDKKVKKAPATSSPKGKKEAAPKKTVEEKKPAAKKTAKK